MKTPDGLWKLSPSGLYTFEECRACFWIDQHLGRLPSIPMRLNDAMDEKLKRRYDSYRKEGKLPPEIADLKGVHLFENQALLGEWRTNTASLSYENRKDGYVLVGKLDEVLVTDKEEHMPADYKSSGDEPRSDKQKYYRLQLHAYALMLKGKGFLPANRAYLLHYFTKDRGNSSLSMEFNNHIDEVALDLASFEETLRKMVLLLEGAFPGANRFCQKCLWHEKRKSY
ncbi:MAG: PD-(D/E)XK nuclease family protein [bacterium]|nr:PD-(D/E)XK nuclease family protein [bacterium]